MFLVDTAKGRIVGDHEIKAELAAAQPYQQWLDDNLVELDDLPAPRPRAAPAPRRRRRASRCSATPPKSSRSSSSPWPAPAASRSARWAPTRRSPCSRRGRGCCSTTSPSCSPRSPTRRSTPSARSWSPRSAARSGPRATCSTRRPGRAARSTWPGPIIDNDELAKLAQIDSLRRHGRLPVGHRSRACSRCPRAASAWPTPSTTCAAQASEAIEGGANIIILSDRHSTAGAGARSRRCCSPRGAPPPHPREDPHPGRPGRRVRRRPRGAPHGLLLGLRRRRHQPLPGLRVHRGPHRPGPDRASPTRSRRVKQLHQGLRQGRAEGDVQDGHLHGRLLHRRPDLRGHRPVPRAGRRVLHRHRQPPRRRRPRRAGRRGRACATAWPTPTAPRSGPTASSRSAASTSGAARASTTCSTPRPCSSCSTPPAPKRYEIFKEYTRRGRRPGRELATLRGLFRFRDGAAPAGARSTRSSRSARSSSASPPGPCPTARSRPRPTRRWPSP